MQAARVCPRSTHSRADSGSVCPPRTSASLFTRLQKTGLCWMCTATCTCASVPSEQHVLVVNGPLAPSLGLQLVVRIPLRDVGVGVAQQRPPSHRLAPPQRDERRWGRVGGGVGAGKGLAPRLGDRHLTGAGGAGGRGLTGAAGQAAVSQAGLRTPPVEGEGDEESACGGERRKSSLGPKCHASTGSPKSISSSGWRNLPTQSATHSIISKCGHVL